MIKQNKHANNDTNSKGALFAERFYKQVGVINQQLIQNLNSLDIDNHNPIDLSIIIINTVLSVFLFLKLSNKNQLWDYKQLPEKITLKEFILFLTAYTNIHKNDVIRQLTDPNIEVVYNLPLDSKVLIKLIRILNIHNYDFSQTAGSKNKCVINNQILCGLYEMLANNSFNQAQKAQSGIFYTQKDEIKLMCQLALADNLINHLGSEFKNAIYDFIFAEEEIAQLESLNRLNKLDIAPKILEKLETVTIIDPSCGSGGFLIEMLLLLADLREKISNKPRYTFIEDIIRNNLYGIDVKQWACKATISHFEFIYLENRNIDSSLDLPEETLRTNIITSDSIMESWCDLYQEIYRINKGFDIIISNPPYIRHENIMSPSINGLDKIITQHKNYKNALIKNIQHLHNGCFSCNSDKTQIKFDAKSDIYVYFYFTSLFNLNDKGTLCFITSNSWLDVDFGIPLQNFLVDQFHLKLLIDNNSNRSFESADINTVITLVSNVLEDKNSEKKSLFLTIHKHFEDVKFKEVLKKIGQLKGYTKNETYTLLPLKQSKLDSKSNDNKPKWGSKYLRAPEIYSILKNKASMKLIPLKDCCDIRFGIKSGANNFFYLTSKDIKNWEIEPEFLKPFLYSFKEVKKLKIDETDLNKKLFICNSSKQELVNGGFKKTLEYIKWGESEKFHLRPSIKKRVNWYTLPQQDDMDFVSNRFLGERFGFPVIKDIPVCDVFFTGKFTTIKSDLGCALINSTLSYLFAEVIARKTYGIGVAYLYGPELNSIEIIHNTFIKKDEESAIINTFTRMANRDLYKISKEIKQPDRRDLDTIIFDILSLTAYERDAIYEELINLVENRQKKANSFKH